MAMNAALWPEERAPFAAAFEAVSTVRPLGPVLTLSTLENGGWAVWDEHKSFWSPAPGKADELKRDLKQAIAEKLTPYVQDATELLHHWPFWARFEQLPPGRCPILTPEARAGSLRVIEYLRERKQGNG